MKRLPVPVLTLILCALFVSCQKELSYEGGPSISGTYKFISMQAKTISTVQTSMPGDVGKTVTIAQYVTKDNSGTIKFEKSTITSTALAYSIDTLMMSYLYSNGVLYDSLEMPFQVQVPPSSGSAPYKMITSDSIYFSSGSMFSGGLSQQSIPYGAKLRTEGQKLYMTIRLNQTSTHDTQGTTVVSISEVFAIITFEKI